MIFNHQKSSTLHKYTWHKSIVIVVDVVLVIVNDLQQLDTGIVHKVAEHTIVVNV